MISLFSFILTIFISTLSAVQGFQTEAGVIVLTDQNFDEFLTKVKEEKAAAMVEFYAPWCPHCKRLAPEYEKAAKLVDGLKPTIYMAKYDCDVHTQKKQRYGVRGYPSLKIWRNGKNEPIDYDGERTAKDIANQLKIEAGIIERPKRKSQPLPSEAKENGVTIVVGETFDSIVKDESKNVLIFFYAPWCSHCKKFKPKYESFAQQFANEEDLVVAKIDATANDWDSYHYKVKSYPTVYLAKKKIKDVPFKYSGERSVEGLTKFLQEQDILSTSDL